MLFMERFKGFELPKVDGLREYVIDFIESKSKGMFNELVGQVKRVIFGVSGLRQRTGALARSIKPYTRRINQYACDIGVSIGENIPYTRTHIGRGPTFTVRTVRKRYLTIPLTFSPVWRKNQFVGFQHGLANVYRTRSPNKTVADFPGIFRLRNSDILAISRGSKGNKRIIGVFKLGKFAEIHSQRRARTDPDVLQYAIESRLSRDLPAKVDNAVKEFLNLKRNWFRSVY